MERTLSAEERIRRAEEIYYKRKNQNQGVRVSTNTSSKSIKADYKLFYKIIMQVLICIVIYVIFYLVQNSDYIFSEDLVNSTKGILSYDINFQKVYKEINSYITNMKGENNGNNDNKDENNNNIETNQVIENQVIENQVEQNPITEENIGGAERIDNLPEMQNMQNEGNLEAQNLENQTPVNPNEGLSQMEIDANYIKSKYSLIKPIVGTITSRYGSRNPTTASVPKNHTGIDIAANKGTAIYAALDGIVKIASSEGDYGKHLRIEKDDIAIYYAHCSKLCVEEGQQINQGDLIAEVGSTGNATGPHLHFEIRREERYIDPDLIMDF